MSDDWDFYQTQIDSKPGSIFVDLGIAQEAPLRDRPRAAYLRVFMRAPRPDGLSSQEEFDALIAVEDAVVAAAEAVGWLYVGRSTSDGNRDFFFYGQDGEAIQAAMIEVMGGFDGYHADMGQRDDPDWSSYFEFLHPSERSRQTISNRRVRELLANEGDQDAIPRVIDHLALFPDMAGAAAFIAAIAGQGFAILQPEAQDEVGVSFSRSGRPSEMDEVCLDLVDAARAAGGRYDGWGCEVQTG
ncbi:DUF695 domain-containing protein [Caulobacter sp. 602-2]|uniref:DUF695 domain-containing protein n=1 Tax=Caulobacter sp. 602-2 TaxID=2710887 RepID=A0A6G4QYU8_9CAUL|nr:DUF695 domain-containing protein [Caulobacter sp. 602-2]NGM50108.1 DUF695 domain-containing protein [Caulobacter sp. 602-2]